MREGLKARNMTWGCMSRIKILYSNFVSKPFGHSIRNRNCSDKPKKFGNAIYKTSFDFNIRYYEY
jgi:hypothetical protein